MRDILILLAITGGVIFGMKSCTESDWYKAGERDRAAQERAEQTPHVIREKDSCKVYAFKAGDAYHYFTSCPNATVTTDRSYTETCGKHCTKQKVETIVTRSTT